MAHQPNSFPEFRAMVVEAQRLVDGAISPNIFRRSVLECAHVMKYLNVHEGIRCVVDRWSDAIERHWDEWGLIDPHNTLSDDQLVELIRLDLQADEPHATFRAIRCKAAETEAPQGHHFDQRSR